VHSWLRRVECKEGEGDNGMYDCDRAWDDSDARGCEGDGGEREENVDVFGSAEVDAQELLVRSSIVRPAGRELSFDE